MKEGPPGCPVHLGFRWSKTKRAIKRQREDLSSNVVPIEGKYIFYVTAIILHRQKNKSDVFLISKRLVSIKANSTEAIIKIVFQLPFTVRVVKFQLFHTISIRKSTLLKKTSKTIKTQYKILFKTKIIHNENKNSKTRSSRAHLP